VQKSYPYQSRTRTSTKVHHSDQSRFYLLCKNTRKSHSSSLTCNIPNNTSQHGFKSKHSITTALHSINNTITTGFNKKKPPERTIAVALDMNKAFDTANHHILLQKLLTTKTPNNVIKFIANYIKGKNAYTITANAPAQAGQILPRPPVCRHPRQRTGPLQTRLLQLSVFQSSRHHHKQSTASPKQRSARRCTLCALQRPYYTNPAFTSLASHPPTSNLQHCLSNLQNLAPQTLYISLTCFTPTLLLDFLDLVTNCYFPLLPSKPRSVAFLSPTRLLQSGHLSLSPFVLHSLLISSSPASKRTSFPHEHILSSYSLSSPFLILLSSTPSLPLSPLPSVRPP
jgi:hypothetical protein